MSDLSITVSPGVIISLLSVMGGAIASLVTFCGHMLINMNKMLTTIVRDHAVAGAEVAARLTVLERHDKANQEEGSLLLSYLKGHESK